MSDRDDGATVVGRRGVVRATTGRLQAKLFSGGGGLRRDGGGVLRRGKCWKRRSCFSGFGDGWMKKRADLGLGEATALVAEHDGGARICYIIFSLLLFDFFLVE